MKNILSYVLEYRKKSFKTFPFCEVDSLVLSQLSYLKYDIYLPKLNPKPIKLKKLAYLKECEDLFLGIFKSRNYKKLFNYIVESTRYQDISICFHTNEFDPLIQKQFSATTFLLNDNLSYLAYRGTDNTVIGWKENFNMSFMPFIPSQKAGVNYINQIASYLPGFLILGGHSKGGNLAVYSGIFCQKPVKDRIIAIYDHDGPGFSQDVFSNPAYLEIKDKIHKTIPQSSIVGLLLQNHENYKIVKSKSLGIMQHDLFSWEINKNELVCLDRVANSSKYTNIILNEWLNQTDEETRKIFFDTIYQIIAATNVTNLNDIKKNWRKNYKIILKATFSLDAEVRDMVIQTMKSFIKALNDKFAPKN